MTHDEMIAILEAHRDGKTIQCRHLSGGEWETYAADKRPPAIAPHDWEYRVKSEPIVVRGPAGIFQGHAIYMEGDQEAIEKFQEYVFGRCWPELAPPRFDLYEQYPEYELVKRK